MSYAQKLLRRAAARLGLDASGEYLGYDSHTGVGASTPVVGGFTGTPGGVPFADVAGALTEDEAEFFWDDNIKALGVGAAPATEKLRVDAETGKIGLNVTADNASAIVGTSQSGSGVAGASVADRGVDGTSQGGPSGYFQSGAESNTSPTLMAVRATAGAAVDLFAATDEGQNALLSITKSGAMLGVVQADPAAPAAGRGVLYFKTVGGKVALIARFPTGAVQQIAIEP